MSGIPLGVSVRDLERHLKLWPGAIESAIADGERLARDLSRGRAICAEIARLPKPRRLRGG